MVLKWWIRYIYEVEELDFLIVIYYGGLNKISNSMKNKKVSLNEVEKLMEEFGVIDLMIIVY